MAILSTFYTYFIKLSNRLVHVLKYGIFRNRSVRIFRVNITTLIKALFQNGRNLVGKR